MVDRSLVKFRSAMQALGAAALLYSLVGTVQVCRAQGDIAAGYEVTETGAASPAVAANNKGPVRMLRFSLVDGNVTWRPDPSSGWAQASTNQPIRQGSEIYVPAKSRAEVQFDDGSVVRLGGGALVTFQTLYSDDQGEFTEIKLNDGLATFRLKNNVSIYQIDTPFASAKAAGPANVRIGVGKVVEIADRAGSVTVEAPQQKVTLNGGQFLALDAPTARFAVESVPPDDEWNHWNEARDHSYDTGSPQARQYLPSNLYLTAYDLDGYGAWRNDPHYGHVWCPREGHAWRPYHQGHWVWVDPFGWTWVADEPWGWAPYHYGTWVHEGDGWGWCPGPASQYWCPAVVSFSSYNGSVGWAPLCPEEIHYPPTLAIGFSSGNWSFLFSIGGCASYYPGQGDYCVARAWNTVYVNNVTYVSRYGGFGGRPLYTQNYNSYRSAAFIPRNARVGGGSFASNAAFGGHGTFGNVDPKNIGLFQHGRAVGAPAAGRNPAAGPANVRPSLSSLSATRSFSRAAPPSSFASRPMYRAPLSPQVNRVAPSFTGKTVSANLRPAAATTRPNAAGTRPAGSFARPGVKPAGNAPAAVRAARTEVQGANHTASSAARPNHAATTAIGAAHANAAHANAAHANAAHTNAAHANAVHANAAHANAAHASAVHANAAHANAAHANAVHANAAHANAAHANAAHANAVHANAAHANAAHANAVHANAAHANAAHANAVHANAAHASAARSISHRSTGRTQHAQSHQSASRPQQRQAAPRQQRQAAPRQQQQSAPREERQAAPSHGGGGGGGSHGGGGGGGSRPAPKEDKRR